MIQSSRWNFKPLVGKVMIGLVLTAIMGSISVSPSYADDGYRRGRGDNRRYENRGHGYGHGRWHDRRGYRYYDDGYRERIYVEPPVYYAPPPRPGIHVFFPPIYINP
jgi:hypothetical protein